MNALGFITCCMGRLRFLKRTLGAIAGQAGCSVVVVDYSCPDGAGEWVDAAYPGVRVVREPGHATYNQCRARNLGARAASAEWLCFIDADILLAPTFTSAVLPLLEPGHYYRAEPLDDAGTWGTFLCRKADFERVGGFDEVFQGWGDADVDFYEALERGGVKRRSYPASLLQHLPHDDDERVRHYENKDRWQNCSINRLYRMIKSHIVRLRGSDLTLAEREYFYRVAVGNVTAAVADGQARQLTLKLGDAATMPGGWSLGCSLTYRYEPPGAEGR